MTKKKTFTERFDFGEEKREELQKRERERSEYYAMYSAAARKEAALEDEVKTQVDRYVNMRLRNTSSTVSVDDVFVNGKAEVYVRAEFSDGTSNAYCGGLTWTVTFRPEDTDAALAAWDEMVKAWRQSTHRLSQLNRVM